MILILGMIKKIQSNVRKREHCGFDFFVPFLLKFYLGIYFLVYSYK